MYQTFAKYVWDWEYSHWMLACTTLQTVTVTHVLIIMIHPYTNYIPWTHDTRMETMNGTQRFGTHVFTIPQTPSPLSGSDSLFILCPKHTYLKSRCNQVKRDEIQKQRIWQKVGHAGKMLQKTLQHTEHTVLLNSIRSTAIPPSTYWSHLLSARRNIEAQIRFLLFPSLFAKRSFSKRPLRKAPLHEQGRQKQSMIEWLSGCNPKQNHRILLLRPGNKNLPKIML